MPEARVRVRSVPPRSDCLLLKGVFHAPVSGSKIGDNPDADVMERPVAFAPTSSQLKHEEVMRWKVRRLGFARGIIPFAEWRYDI